MSILFQVIDDMLFNLSANFKTVRKENIFWVCRQANQRKIFINQINFTAKPKNLAGLSGKLKLATKSNQWNTCDRKKPLQQEQTFFNPLLFFSARLFLVF